jgi:hypothetical protein
MIWFFALAALALAQPVPLEVAPAAGAVVDEDRPCIQVSWPEGTLSSSHCRLWINGREVTNECLRSTRFLSFRPYQGPPAGPMEVRFLSQDGLGQPIEKIWTFQLAPQTWIKDLQHNGQTELFEDDVLEVSFRAPTRGKASFRVGPLNAVPMPEREPGLYAGSLKVRTGDNALGAQLVVTYARADHQEVAQAGQRLNVFGGFYRVKVLSPPDGSVVEQSFVVKGHARPGSRVSVVPRVGFSDVQAPTTTSAAVRSTAGSIPAEVDEHGDFQLEYGLPLVLPGMQVVMTIYAVDPDGTRSVPTVVRYRFK